ncbi:hypothetical protein BTH_I2106 [Burkholderia thailandensis E264]|uniref:Uncharacterized protein n=1 Tax=Burkholderia thailandensis (strain ATCC 700388 / DSM 13276 / CCUG 48851 / CIP 106301 / E264) TaxID=271848 RepID=Q2SWS0_BURTA|nr:hypothetical protein BTH_I2106 [Burkholderia thailandensis E264]
MEHGFVLFLKMNGGNDFELRNAGGHTDLAGSRKNRRIRRHGARRTTLARRGFGRAVVH